MRSKAKHTSSLYEFLDKTGVLVNGSEAEILAAKKQYWKEYKAAWRIKQRQETHEYKIVCQPHEARVISNAAKSHKRSLQAFIKEAVLAYIRRVYIVPDVIAINSMQQQLAINYNVLQTLFDESIIPYQTGKALLENADELERKVMDQLRSPFPIVFLHPIIYSAAANAECFCDLSLCKICLEEETLCLV